ncbi:hypothetical protein BHE74_00053322 [Ensete ventricosum]|nr:hypothetical protein BHE74_00053322 [Ensete ventricosum]
MARPRPRPPARGRLAATRASPQGASPVGAAGCMGNSPHERRLWARWGAYKGLPPVGVAVSAVGVATPWQGDSRRAPAQG